MRILDDGRVEITNRQTGEVRQVQPEELGSYSPFLANQYSKYIGTLKTKGEIEEPGGGNPFPFLNQPGQVSGPSNPATGQIGGFNPQDVYQQFEEPDQPTEPTQRQPWDVSFGGNITPEGFLNRESIPYDYNASMNALNARINQEVNPNMTTYGQTGGFGIPLRNIRL